MHVYFWGGATMENKELVTSDNKLNERVCINCGNSLVLGQKFCSNCGKPIDDNTNLTNLDYNASSQLNMPEEKTKGKLLRWLVIGVICLVVIVGAFVVWRNILPEIDQLKNPEVTVSVEELLNQGNYEQAYKNAEDDKKDMVLKENIIAYQCNISAENLKDPDSFNLRNAWFNDDTGEMVLYISGKNGFGGVTSTYWYYTYNEDSKEYELFVALNDLEDEEVYSWDDSDEELEKLLNNLARSMIKLMIEDEHEIDKAIINRINSLHENEKLSEIVLLDDINILFNFKEELENS